MLDNICVEPKHLGKSRFGYKTQTNVFKILALPKECSLHSSDIKICGLFLKQTFTEAFFQVTNGFKFCNIS